MTKKATPVSTDQMVTIRYCAKVPRIVHNLPTPGAARRFKPGDTIEVGEAMASRLTARLVYGEKQWDRVVAVNAVNAVREES